MGLRASVLAITMPYGTKTLPPQWPICFHKILHSSLNIPKSHKFQTLPPEMIKEKYEVDFFNKKSQTEAIIQSLEIDKRTKKAPIEVLWGKPYVPNCNGNWQKPCSLGQQKVRGAMKERHAPGIVIAMFWNGGLGTTPQKLIGKNCRWQMLMITLEASSSVLGFRKFYRQEAGISYAVMIIKPHFPTICTLTFREKSISALNYTIITQTWTIINKFLFRVFNYDNSTCMKYSVWIHIFITLFWCYFYKSNMLTYNWVI